MPLKRAVLYARVSGDDRGKEGRNLEGQLELGRKYALSRGYQIVEELSEDDRGASGASFDLEQLNQALEMARAGEFDVLVVRELDRFARSLAKQLVVELQFKRAGVEVDYVLGEYPDTPEGNLNKNIKAVVAEYERFKITERMVRGRRQKVRAGHVLVGGRPPYGYMVTDQDGKRTLAPRASEARIVRMVFEWYAYGDKDGAEMTISGIAQRLNDLHVPTYFASNRRLGEARGAGSGDWARSVIGRMLRNRVYIGEWRYGKGRREEGHYVRNPKEHILIVRVPAIVDQALWDAVQERLTHNRKTARTRKYSYLLSGRVRCGECGHSVTGHARQGKSRLYRYYRCTVRSHPGEFSIDCTLPLFPGDRVDREVWAWVKSLLVDPDQLAHGLRAYKASRDQKARPLQDRMEALQDLVDENLTKLERLLDVYLEGVHTREVLLARQKQLETTLSSLETEQGDLARELERRTITEEQITSLQEFAQRVTAKIDVAAAGFASMRRVIELLDVRAVLVVEDGEKVIYVSCGLGRGRVLPESQTTIELRHQDTPTANFAFIRRIVLDPSS